jgi:hypothetical protein
MIRELRIYWKLRPMLEQLKGLSKMKLSTSLVFQALAIVAHGINQISGLVPPKYQWLVAGAIGILQGINVIGAHFYNPDGTPATQAYVKAK